MRTRMRLALLALILGPVVVGAQKPVVERQSFVDGPAAPRTVKEMIEQTDAAVVAEYGGQVRLKPDPREGYPLYSIHTFTIRDAASFLAEARKASLQR